MTDRRAFLAAALVAPIAIAAPATAHALTCQSNSDLEAAITRYRDAWAEYQAHPVHDTLLDDPNYVRINNDGDLVADRSDQALEAALRLPSRSGKDIATKLELILSEYENCELPERLIQIVADDARSLAREA